MLLQQWFDQELNNKFVFVSRVVELFRHKKLQFQNLDRFEVSRRRFEAAEVAIWKTRTTTIVRLCVSPTSKQRPALFSLSNRKTWKTKPKLWTSRRRKQFDFSAFFETFRVFENPARYGDPWASPQGFASMKNQ